jgi:hypothetical protein
MAELNLKRIIDRLNVEFTEDTHEVEAATNGKSFSSIWRDTMDLMRSSIKY